MYPDAQHIQKVREATKDALINRKFKKGFSTGGRCFGFRSKRKGEGVIWVRHTDEAKVVRGIYKAYSEGHGLTAVQHMLNNMGKYRQYKKRYFGNLSTETMKLPREWVESSIHAMLRNKKYIGIIEYGRTKRIRKGGTEKRLKNQQPKVSEHKVPRIVSDVLWAKVQSELKKRYTTHHWKQRDRYLLSGIARCSQCGKGMTGIAHKYYRCSNARCGPTKPLVRRHELDEVILKEAQKVIEQN